MTSLKEAFRNWLEFDQAEFALGVVFGMWPDTPEAFIEKKWMFMTNNKVGAALYSALLGLVVAGFLEADDPDITRRPLNFRWSQAGELARGCTE